MPGAARSSAGRWPTICEPNWCWTRWRWRSTSGGRTASSITATRAANTHRWRSANVARRLVSGRQCDRSVMPTTTPCARASSPRSNANCWSAAGSPPRSRPRWPASASSKVGTTRCGCTQPSATARQWPMKQRWRRSPQNRNHPSPTPLHETGATSTITAVDRNQQPFFVVSDVVYGKREATLQLKAGADLQTKAERLGRQIGDANLKMTASTDGSFTLTSDIAVPIAIRPVTVPKVVLVSTFDLRGAGSAELKWEPVDCSDGQECAEKFDAFADLVK